MAFPDLDLYRADPAVLQRTIVVDVDRSAIALRTETHQLLGAVDKFIYFLWRSKQSPATAHGVYGLKRVIQRMNVTVNGMYPSTNYAMIGTSNSPSLPALILEYVAAHAAADE